MPKPNTNAAKKEAAVFQNLKCTAEHTDGVVAVNAGRKGEEIGVSV